ncbi:MAG: hypothetical protein LBQ46_07350 [Treponema sp.]|jgi:hypothetical protein|nr:hypothetical protein [Treponema sp.]
MKKVKRLKQRHVFQLFDRVFKCLLGLSDKSVINLINGLFGTSYPPDSTVTRPSPEKVEPGLKRSLADMVITINGDPYLIEAQIRNDRYMGVRIFQYILNQGRLSPQKGHTLIIRLPRIIVIYWELTPSTPEVETVIFEFPGGPRYRYEACSFKFPGYSIGELEERGLGILLPFCVLKFRRDVEKAKTAEERRELAVMMRALVEEIAAAAERSQRRGEMTRGDLGNVLDLTEIMYRELYVPSTEFEEEEGMWEHIKLKDYDGAYRERDEAIRERDEIARREAEAARQVETARQAARKLLEMGVPREQLAQAGLLEFAGQPGA